MLRHALTVAALGVLPLLSLLQDPVDAPRPEDGDPDIQDPSLGLPELEPARDVFGRVTANGSEALISGLQGGWVLVGVDDPLLPPDGRSQEGMLLVSGSYMSLEIHMTWYDQVGEPLEDAFQTGVHEFQLDGPDRISTTSLIGSYLDEDDALEWEDPGYTREFQVTLAGDRLILARDDGSSLEFRRRRSQRAQIPNIYGVRPGGTDIFGNPIEEPTQVEPEGGGRR